MQEKNFEITLKEVYERVISLEAKFDASLANNTETSTVFKAISVIIVIMIGINVVISALILLSHLKGML